MSDIRSDNPVVVVERSEGGLAGFLLGIAVGVAVGFLFAPRTGEETRQQLKNTGRRLRVAAAERAEDLQDVFGSGYERTRERVEDGLDHAREVIDEKRDQARDAVDAGKAAVKSARSELERRLAKSKASRPRAERKNDGAEADDDGVEADEEE